MKFEFFKPGEFVFEYNDYGNYFYIIIDGTCSVQVPNEKKQAYCSGGKHDDH